MAEGQPLFITFCILVLIANTLLGVAFSITFHLQIDDFQFNDWREANPRSYRIMRFFFTFFSLHMFRLIYSKLFMIEAFQASATVPHDFIRPLRLYSKLHIFIILVPILTLNIFGMAFTFEGYWDNQLQMTMAETVIMAPLLATLLVIEMFRADPRALLHKPTDENPFFTSMFAGDGGKDDDDEGSASPKKAKKRKKSKDAGVKGKQLDQGESYWELTDKRIRHSQLY